MFNSRPQKFAKSFAVFATTVAMAGLLASCGQDRNDTGIEYAPQMYHTIPYDPYSQVTDTSSEYFNTNRLNPGGTNMRKPAANTVARKFYAGTPRTELAKTVMIYDNLIADSVELSGRILKNPLVPTEALLAQGETLYLRYCSPCHGAGGAGDGKVAEKYKGVPNYSTGRYATLPEGHIFHTITFGKGRMWPHGSQINPEDRWKIVMYVQKLQKGQS
jgi:mono/diheme cytochrome c family protein